MSSLLHRLFSSCGEQRLLSSCGAWTSHCSGFSCRGALRLYSVGASVVASSGALEHRLSNCGRSLFLDKLPPLNRVYKEVLNVHESFNTKPGTYIVNAS